MFNLVILVINTHTIAEQYRTFVKYVQLLTGPRNVVGWPEKRAKRKESRGTGRFPTDGICDGDNDDDSL